MSDSKPRTRGRSHNIIRGGDGKVLYEYDNDQNRKSNNTIYSGDGKRILYEDKE
jgi:hypothetical protein